MPNTADSEIRAVIDSWAEAMRRKDAKGVTRHLSPGFLLYSLAPPLKSSGDNPSALQAWFDTWEGDLTYEMRDLAIVASGDVAFTHSLNFLAGIKAGEGRNEIWFRQTLGLRKMGSAWKIVHEHESVPFYMDGSMRAAVDLKP